MLQQVLCIGSNKSACKDLFIRMKLPHSIKCVEAYPNMVTTMSYSFDAIVIIMKDLPLGYIKEV